MGGTSLSAQSQPHEGCFHKFSYHTPLPSHWIPATARQVPTHLLQPPGLCHSNPKKATAQSHWTQENEPTPAPANTSPGQLLGPSAAASLCAAFCGKWETCKNTQIFHRPSSTLPGNMSAVSGAELGGGGCAELVILGCFLGPVSSNAKQPSMAKMRKKFQKQLSKHSVYRIQSSLVSKV